MSLPPASTLTIPPVPRLTTRPSNYHTFAEQLRSSLLLFDPVLWLTISSGKGPRTDEEHELNNLRACAWIYMHLPEEVTNFLRAKKLDRDARGLWEAIREGYAPEACREGNERCGVCAKAGYKFAK